MDVFIGNLPGEATLASLDSFLGGLHLKADFECHSGRDRRSRSYHFLVARTEAPEAGRELIRQLNGRVFEGHTLEAREYIQRRPGNTWQGAERRVNA
jgi:hypothetical protein